MSSKIKLLLLLLFVFALGFNIFLVAIVVGSGVVRIETGPVEKPLVIENIYRMHEQLLEQKEQIEKTKKN